MEAVLVILAVLVFVLPIKDFLIIVATGIATLAAWLGFLISVVHFGFADTIWAILAILFFGFLGLIFVAKIYTDYVDSKYVKPPDTPIEMIQNMSNCQIHRLR